MTDGGSAGDAHRTDATASDAASVFSALVVSPATATIIVVNGVATPATATFTAQVMQSNGTTEPATGLVWGLASPDYGSIDAMSGVFTPSLTLGGTVDVLVHTTGTPQLEARATISITLNQTVLGAGVSASDQNRVDNGTPASSSTAQSPQINYPLANAVMPRNVHAPDFMWTPQQTPTSSDIYRVTLTREHAVLAAYLLNAAGFTNDWRPPADAWNAFAATDVGTPITLQVDVASNGMLLGSTPLQFTTVDAVIAGKVYYWSPTVNHVLRVDVVSGQSEDFMPNPSSCFGCHAITRDGRRMAGELAPDGNPDSATAVTVDLTANLTANPAPPLTSRFYGYNVCSSYNADGTRLLLGDCGRDDSGEPMSLLDTSTGQVVTPAVGTPGDGFDPEWSPDGQWIAYSDRSDNIALTAAMAGDQFGAPMVSQSASGAIDWHPTWSPDSHWLVFQHGDQRTSNGSGSLWIGAPMSGTAIPLNALNGGASENDTYRPVFSPYDSGGYFWVLFTTTRNYGNALAGLQATKQVWVAAIHDRPDGTTDPSAVGYYLDGQETVTNLSPNWAAPPCVPMSGPCAAGADCCSNNCVMDPDTQMQSCQPPVTCHARGGMCSVDSDCCNGLACAGNICDMPPG